MNHRSGSVFGFHHQGGQGGRMNTSLDLSASPVATPKKKPRCKIAMAMEAAVQQINNMQNERTYWDQSGKQSPEAQRSGKEVEIEVKVDVEKEEEKVVIQGEENREEGEESREEGEGQEQQGTLGEEGVVQREREGAEQ